MGSNQDVLTVAVTDINITKKYYPYRKIVEQVNTGARFMFMKMSTVMISDALDAGDPAVFEDLDTVSNDVSRAKGYDGTNGARCAGISLADGIPESTSATTYYGFVQVSGYHSAVKTDGNVAAGDHVQIVTTDQAVLRVTSTSVQLGKNICGYALDDDTAGSLVKLMIGPLA